MTGCTITVYLGQILFRKEEKVMATKMHKYLITSERAMRRDDERDNLLRSSNVYRVGQVIILDGLKWTVTRVIE